MSQDRVLYWGSGSPSCWRVMVALEEKGLPYESKLLEFSKGEHKSAEVTALNPRGQLPTFKDGDAVVNESGAICLYLESQYPDKALLPSEPAAKAKVLQRFFEAVVLEGTVRKYLDFKFQQKEDPNEEQHIKGIKDELALWDSYLSKDKYAAADVLTLADAMFGPYILVMTRFGMTLKDYPNLQRYRDLIKEHPSFVKTWPPHYKENPPKQTYMNVF